jgi:hypothetical protein
MRPRTAHIILILAIVAVAILLFANRSYSQPVQPERVKSNMELLGEVTTVVDKDDPLVAELKADDQRTGRR